MSAHSCREDKRRSRGELRDEKRNSSMKDLVESVLECTFFHESSKDSFRHFK